MRFSTITAALLPLLAFTTAFDFDTDLGDPVIPDSVENQLDRIEDRLDRYDNQPNVDRLDDALESATDRWAATQTAYPTGGGDDDDDDNVAYQLGRLSVAHEFLSTQTIVTGGAKESILSDVEEYVAIVQSAVGSTAVPSASASATGSASGSETESAAATTGESSGSTSSSPTTTAGGATVSTVDDNAGVVNRVSVAAVGAAGLLAVVGLL